MEKKRGKINYALLHKIEAKYINIADCPEDDEDLIALRLAMNLPADGIGGEYERKLEFNRAKRKREEDKLADKDTSIS